MRILVLILPMVVYSRWLNTVLYSNVFFRKIQNIFKRKLFNAFTVVAIAVVVVFVVAVATVKYYDDNQSFLFHTVHWWFTDQHKLWLILINMHVNNILKAENEKNKIISHSHTYSHQFISWFSKYFASILHIFFQDVSKSISWNESAQ